MYGTVMIGKVAAGVSVDDYRKAADEWRQARPTVGFVDELVLLDDGGRLVLAVRFESKEAYLALADDPGQDEWWTTVMAPMLDGEPEWIDGDWVYDSRTA